MLFVRCAVALAAAALALPLSAAEPTVLDPVQVTATRLPESVSLVPAAISVVRGEELRARGASDLRTALSLVAGVEISPGGDGGPAGSIPAFYGFREFDAFVLVVDGVPVGGAFNPTLSTLDLHNVKQIEVLRGAAPVMYGATSFVGVIHVIHYPAGESESRVTARIGDPLSAGATVAKTISTGDIRQSVSGEVSRDRFTQDRSSVNRGHALYRLATTLKSGGKLTVDADYTLQRQEPQGTTRREGVNGVQVLTDAKTPVDANHNPSDAAINEDRKQITAGYTVATGYGEWGNLLSATHTGYHALRGFLFNQNGTNPAQANAKGFFQDRDIAEIYFDSHLSRAMGPVNVVAGVDWLYGSANVDSTSFNYYAARDGSFAQSGKAVAANNAATVTSATSIGRTAVVSSEDTRNFLGAYVQGDWKLAPTVNLLAGLRLNHTREELRNTDFTPPTGTAPVATRDRLDKTRLSGTLGATWRAWESGADHVVAYADYRNSYKPYAYTFQPKSRQQIERAGARPLTTAEATYSARIYAPETADAYEIGFKGALLGGRLTYDLSGFYQDFESLTYTAAPNGGFFPGGQMDGGKIRFRGGEFEARYLVVKDLSVAAQYAYHSAIFARYNTDDGTSVTGNRFEMSPRGTAGLGVIYTPALGFNGSVIGNYTGGRFLNKKNTGPIASYTNVDAHLGYALAGGLTLSVDATNLTDNDDATSESEYSESVAGAASYYRLPGRAVWFTVGKTL